MNLKFNIAEFFGFIRILTFPVMLFFILMEWRMIAAWSYTVLFSTDVLDGFLARVLKKETIKRAKLDSYGDISFLIPGLTGIYVFERDFFISHLSVILIVIGGYILQLTLSLLKFGEKTNFHTILAKIAAFLQAVFISFTFFFQPLEQLFYIVALVSIIEIIEEIVITLAVKKLQHNIYGIWHWKKIKSGR